MTDRWVSLDRYYCRYCDIHLVDNKANRISHENGAKHKQNVLKLYGRIQEEERKKESDKREAERILQNVEREAVKSFLKYDCNKEVQKKLDLEPVARRKRPRKIQSMAVLVSHVEPKLGGVTDDSSTIPGEWEEVKKGDLEVCQPRKSVQSLGFLPDRGLQERQVSINLETSASSPVLFKKRRQAS